jgi:hypothetical protein
VKHIDKHSSKTDSTHSQGRMRVGVGKAAVLAIYRHCIPIGLLPQENADRQQGLVRMRIKEQNSLRKREQSETTFSLRVLFPNKPVDSQNFRLLVCFTIEFLFSWEEQKL